MKSLLRSKMCFTLNSVFLARPHVGKPGLLPRTRTVPTFLPTSDLLGLYPMSSFLSSRFSCCCFVWPSSPPFRRVRSTKSQVTMRKGKSSGKKRPASRLSPQQKAQFADIASDYGLDVSKPGSQLDRKYNQPSKAEERPTVYQWLASSVGVANLEMIEKSIFVVLGGLLLFVISGGLIISSEAFFKASGKPVPEGLDAVATGFEGVFTPSLLLFLALSSILGIYKQFQLSSGASSYTELGSEPEDK